MGLFFAIIITVSFVMVVFHYWKQFCGEEFTVEEWNFFRRWLFTGVVIPAAIWLAFNTGFLGGPVWPYVTPISSSVTGWWRSFRSPMSFALIWISSYWAGISLIWLLCRARQCAAEPGRFRAVCLSWSVVLVPVAVIMVVFEGWFAFGLALMVIAGPMVHFTLQLQPEKPPAPSYAGALAKLNFGKYEEAETAVIQELEQCEDDFDGWMMLAELYAVHFNDLSGAVETVRDLCSHPTTTPSQVSVALHRLADWQLKIAHDPDAARRALETISARMPGTHLDRMARLRISRLPATREELVKQEQGKPLVLPRVPDDDGFRPIANLRPEEAAGAANRCVEQLKRNPDDVAAREKFAHLLAEQLGNPKTAIEQLELLLAMRGQPPARRAEWLMTIAQWHARFLEDTDTAKLIYQEVLRDFPASQQAFAAQRRINLINLQAQFRRRAVAPL
jgi:hypothetical protein